MTENGGNIDLLTTLLVLAPLLSAWFITRLLRPRHHVDGVLTFALAWSTLIVLLAYLASACHALGHTGVWVGASLALLAGLGLRMTVHAPTRALCLAKPIRLRDLRRRLAGVRLPVWDAAILGILGVTALVAAAATLVVLLAHEPVNADALEYHLARIAYYLQYGSLAWYDTAYWAQVAHPKVATALQLYAMLTGHLQARMAAVPQFLAYLVCAVAIYGIARKLGGRRRGGLFAALTFCLLVTALLEANAVLNDLIQAAFFGCTLYFILAFQAHRSARELALAGVAFALGAGVKATFMLVLPSLALIGWHLWQTRHAVAALPSPTTQRKPGKGRVPRPPQPARDAHWSLGLVGAGVGLLLITLPAGYAQNLVRYGNLFGPPVVRTLQTTAELAPEKQLSLGTLNLMRYAIDGLRLDGLPAVPSVLAVQETLVAVPRIICKQLHLNLEVSSGVRVSRGNNQFRYVRVFTDENTAGWGILGFALIWPVLLIALCHRQWSATLRWFALAAIIFCVVQSMGSLYDIWHPRFFLLITPIALPPLALLSFSGRVGWLGRGYVTLIMLLGCVTALLTVAFRENLPLLSHHITGQRQWSCLTRLHPPNNSSGLSDVQFEHLANRCTQLTKEVPNFNIGYFVYEQVVPANATVALDCPGTVLPDFLFFGEHLTRRIVPLWSFDSHRLPLPDNADYLIYTDKSPNACRPLFTLGHIVGDTIYLAKLHADE